MSEKQEDKLMYDELVKRLREKAGAFDYDGRSDIACDYEQAADAIEERSRKIESLESMREITPEAEYAIDKHADNIISHMEELIRGLENKPRWIPVTERLPECDLGAEVGNIEWISCGMVHAGCFGRGGKYRDAYFRTWTDAGEGMDAKDADYWRAVTPPEPPKEE